MNLTPFFESTFVIQLHVYAAIFAIFLGAFILSARKGTARHKHAGRVWVGIVAVVAISSFAIHEIRTFGWFSPLHLLSILTLVALFSSVHAIRSGAVERHQNSMKWLFFAGLLIPGFFAFLPGRTMSNVFIEPWL